MPLNFFAKNTAMVEVRAATFPIGTITTLMQPKAGGGPPVEYRWHLTISAAPAGFIRDGRTSSLEDAKAAMENAWQTWVSSAGLTEKIETGLSEKTEGSKNATDVS